MSNIKHAVIIGGGIGGLATANILAKAGYKVSLYESHSSLGGRAGLLEVDGFRFDTGPSWYLMPEVFEQYFKLFGKDVSKLLDLQRLDPAYQVYFGDSTQELVSADLLANKQLFKKLEQDSGPNFDKYLKRSKLAYEVSLKHFLYNPFTSIKTLFNLEVVKHLPSLFRLISQPLHTYVKGYFKNPRAQQLLEYPAVFLGASPYIAPALFSLMSYVDLDQGVYYPQRGMYTIVEELVKLGKQLEVNLHLDSPVKSINVEVGLASGITLESGEVVDADIVISNSDLHHTETKMLDSKFQTYPEKYWTKKKPGPSAILIYLGIKGRLPQLKHHNLLFIENWKSNFDDTFDSKIWSKPASLYVCMPSASDNSVAPAGHENVFILVPGPSGIDLSNQQLEDLANEYIDQFSKVIKQQDLKQRIVYQKQFGPSQFSEEYFAWEGTALGAAHTLRQSAFFRPSNKSKKVSNLYYVGAGAQPGIGVPLCLISAELVYKHIVSDKSAGPLEEIKTI